MTDTATRRPWHVGGKNNCIVYDAFGHAICNAIVFHGKGGGVEEMQANSALIVKAVNCHDELVEMLRQCRERENNPSNPAIRDDCAG